MDKKKYAKLTEKHKAKEPKILNGTKAFLSGGTIGLLGEVLIQIYSYVLDIPTKDAGIFMIITLIFLASLFTAFGFFDNVVSFFQAGIIIPITGFSHALTSAAIDYKTEGLVTGIGSNMFKLAGTVILYGVTSAYFVGLIRLMIFGG